MNIDKVISYFKREFPECEIETSSQISGSVEIHTVKAGCFFAEIQVEGSAIAVLTRKDKCFTGLEYAENQEDLAEFVLHQFLKFFDKHGFGW